MLRLTLSTTTWFLMSSTPLSLLAYKAPKSGMQSCKRHLRLVNPDLVSTVKGTYKNFLGSLFLTNSTSRSTTNDDYHERRKVLLVGDSITQQSFSVTHGGWGAGLQDWYQRTADVYNRGFSGYNSRWIQQSLRLNLCWANGIGNSYCSAISRCSCFLIVYVLIQVHDMRWPGGREETNRV